MAGRRKRKPASTGTLVGPFIKKFTDVWLPKTRGRSEQTIRSYRGMFKLLAAYVDDRFGVLPSEVTFDMLDEDALLGFVDWMLEVRGLKVSSLNTRLGALKSFAKFIEYELPSEALFCITVRKIKTRKVDEEIVRFMEKEALNALFSEAASRSLRDVAILETLYASGARESEFIALTPRDVRFGKKKGTADIELHGKGKKARVVTIGKHAAATLMLYMGKFCSDPDAPLFTSRKGEGLSASGLAWIVKNCAKLAREKYPGLVPENVHPHMFRHSIATHMLRAGASIEAVRLFLGHASYKTTAVYAKNDPAAVGEAVAAVEDAYIKPVAAYEKAEKDDLDVWISAKR